MPSLGSPHLLQSPGLLNRAGRPCAQPGINGNTGNAETSQQPGIHGNTGNAETSQQPGINGNTGNAETSQSTKPHASSKHTGYILRNYYQKILAVFCVLQAFHSSQS